MNKKETTTTKKKAKKVQPKNNISFENIVNESTNNLKEIEELYEKKLRIKKTIK